MTTRQGDSEEAAALYRQAVDLDYEWITYHIAYWVALHRIGRSDTARDHMVSLSDSIHAGEWPRDFGIQFDAVDFLTGRLSENNLLAVEKEEFEARGTDNATVCYCLGLAYLFGGSIELANSAPDTTRAIRHFQKCLADDESWTYEPAKYELLRLGALDD